MKAKTNYGIYIDSENAFIISLSHLQHEQLISAEEVNMPGNLVGVKRVSQQEHVQNKAHENLAKLTELIISKLTNVNGIFIFGPSRSKYALRNEVRNTAHLKSVNIELAATETMDKERAVKFVQDHYSTFTVGQQIFTASKK